jgi:hypothetical protein
MNCYRVLLVSAFLLGNSVCLAQAPFMFTCAEDTHIPAAKKAQIDSAAMKFMDAVLASNTTAAHELLSTQGKSNVSFDQMSQAIAAMNHLEPGAPAIQHTYFITLQGTSPGSILCAADLTKPHESYSVGAASVPEQAHVILFSETRNNTLALTVWLLLEQDQWKVQSFWMNVATLGNMDSRKLWELGRSQAAKDHMFNASLLYASAVQASNRGPTFQMALARSIEEDAAKLKVPTEIQGPPPYSWKENEATYKVNNVGPIAIAGKLYVVIVHEVCPWESDAQVDGWNKQLLSYFKQRFPEYSDVFAGLVARALEQGTNRGYGTVEELPSP